ncbi:hypothetical protein ES703_107479 [subsurface metagenome]
MRRLGLVGQRHIDGIGGVARTGALTLEPELVVFEVSRLIHIEIDVDRIERDDGCEQGGASVRALHEVADADEMAADAARNRRLDVGELDIELRRLQRAIGLHLGSARRLQCLAALVDDGFGDGAGRNQGQRALEFALGQFGFGAGIGELAVGLQCDRLEGTGVDHIKQVTRLDEIAVLELDGVDEAADPGADLHFVHRLEAASEFIPIGDHAFGRLRDGNRRRRRRRGLRRRLVAAGKAHRQHDGQRRQAVERLKSENFRLS